jgi:hypothetical protein
MSTPTNSPVKAKMSGFKNIERENGLGRDLCEQDAKEDKIFDLELEIEALKYELHLLETEECCIEFCFNRFKYGNNAQPVCEGKCCDDCNQMKVLPARLQSFLDKEEEAAERAEEREGRMASRVME